MAWPCVGDDEILVVPVVVDGPLHAVPAVLDVVKVPPDVAGPDDACIVWLNTNILNLQENTSFYL
jgi:hypothetical protein